MSPATILTRAASAIVTLLGVMVVVFVLVRVVPGDPVSMMIAPGASEADIAALRARYGLDLPIAQQFFVWFGQALHGSLAQPGLACGQCILKGACQAARLPVARLHQHEFGPFKRCGRTTLGAGADGGHQVQQTLHHAARKGALFGGGAGPVFDRDAFQIGQQLRHVAQINQRCHRVFA